MSQDYGFFNWKMPKSRKADYYLGCLDSCVFIDFNLTSDKRINLCRISFDGYGCCNIEQPNALDAQASKEFVSEMQKGDFDQAKITKLVLELIQLNKDYIWLDALEQYNLIDL